MYDYFGIQSKIGITKHVGGLRATRYLIEHCAIDSSSHVLVVGSGNGVSAIKISKMTGSHIVGVDISPEMVKSALKKKDHSVEFVIGDAEKLPFPDGVFDAVISESVTAFTDKHKSLSEYRRVLKKGGYLGLNEVTWLQEPSKEIVDYGIRVIGGLKAETKEGWVGLLDKALFKEVSGEAYPMKKMEQFLGELQMQGSGFFMIWLRFFYYYLFDREYRRSVHWLTKEVLKIPKGFFKCFGYGLYIARK